MLATPDQRCGDDPVPALVAVTAREIATTAAVSAVVGLALTAGVGYVLLLLGGPLLHNIIDD